MTTSPPCCSHYGHKSLPLVITTSTLLGICRAPDVPLQLQLPRTPYSTRTSARRPFRLYQHCFIVYTFRYSIPTQCSYVLSNLLPIFPALPFLFQQFWRVTIITYCPSFQLFLFSLNSGVSAWNTTLFLTLRFFSSSSSCSSQLVLLENQELIVVSLGPYLHSAAFS